jgi:hypothetical protein
MADVKFEVVSLALPTSAQSVDFTISGFGAPIAAIFISSAGNGLDTKGNFGRFMQGACTATTQYVTSVSSNFGSANSVAQRSSRTDNCIRLLDTGSLTVFAEAAFEEFITDGVRVDLTDPPSFGAIVTCILIGGSDVTDAHVGNLGLGTGTAGVPETGVGFEPDLLFVNCIGFGSATALATTNIWSSGVAINDGSETQSCHVFRETTGTAAVQAYSTMNTGAIAAQHNGSSGFTWDGTLTSFDSDGFTVTPSSSAGSDFIHYLALELANSPDIKLFEYTTPTTDIEDTVTTPGFEPTFGMMWTGNNASFDVSDSTTADVLGISAFDATASSYSALFMEDGSLTASGGKISSSAALDAYINNTTSDVTATLTSLNSDGWTLDYSNSPAVAKKYFALAIGPAASGGTSVLTGTTVPTITEADVVTGGKTSIITLTGDTWVAAGATFDAQRQAIIDGFDAAASPTNGWNNEVRDNEVVGSVVRTSSTVVTITWTAAASYDISSTETITGTVPNAALVTGTSDIISTPTFTVTAVASGLPVPVAMFNYRRRR